MSNPDEMVNIRNPIVFFILTWLFVLVLYSLQYSKLLTVLSNSTLLYIGLSCSSFAASYLFVISITKKWDGKTTYFSNIGINKVLKIVFFIWLSLTLVEIAYFRSLPLLALLGIGAGAYTEWGIPSLHGLLNAMIIALSNYFFYLFLTTRNKKYLWFFLFCLCWPILLVTRQVFMSMSVQAVLTYIFLNKFKAKTVFTIALVALCVVFLFGFVGDLRAGDSLMFINLAQPSDDYPAFLPSGFLWVYIYVTSPLNNVNFNIDKYPGFAFNPSYVLSSFFPSFIRNMIFEKENIFDFKLVNQYLNVSSMFPNYLGAFGYWGSILFYFVLGTIFSLVYVKATRKNVNIKWIFIIVVLLHNILFSVFVDFFSNLVFIFQMILHYFIGTKVKFKDDQV
ncbi:putative transmembrane protein [Pedobacter sp. BAL39]|nr:putative transmembrane protein [Pedobacter sp. BAL39]